MSTITTINQTDAISDSRAVINTNFSNLNTDKAEKTGQTFSGLIQFSGTTHAGLKLISLTTTQRDALTPSVGMMIYNTTTSKLESYENNAWVQPSAATSNATTTAAGLLELGTSTEIDSDTASGSAGPLAVTPDQLVLSKYGTRLPSANEKSALAGTSGTAPSGSNKFVDATDVSSAAASGKIVRASGTALPALDGSALTNLVANRLLTQSTADVTISGTTVETTLITYSVPANTLSTSNIIRVKGYIDYTNLAVSHTMTLRGKFGGTTIVAPVYTSLDSNDAVGMFEFVIYGAGTTSSQEGVMMLNTDQNNTPKNKFGKGTSAIDQTSSQTLLLTGQASNSGNNIILRNYSITVEK